ncbi:hypothetical protein B296_00040597 [Ensete ventricosum]|uniref:Uncharacterized protein n=1 Tax=Ensete ventricosum TaxID=4639 RepID=A0A426XKP4_ENSVE|nr:hypothetical protein B296_00040597 [Ensete ventricosum]
MKEDHDDPSAADPSNDADYSSRCDRDTSHATKKKNVPESSTPRASARAFYARLLSSCASTSSTIEPPTLPYHLSKSHWPENMADCYWSTLSNMTRCQKDAWLHFRLQEKKLRSWERLSELILGLPTPVLAPMLDRFNDPEVQRDVKLLPYKIVGKDGKPYIQVKIKDGETKVFSPEEISAMILTKMKETAEAFLGKKIKDAVVTVPGEDFDQRIMEYFIKLIKKKHGKDISKDNRALGKLRRECERAKRALSNQHQVRVEIESLYDGLAFSEPLTRARFV